MVGAKIFHVLIIFFSYDVTKIFSFLYQILSNWKQRKETTLVKTRTTLRVSNESLIERAS